MRPAYYLLLLVNLVQSPNGLYVPMPESPQSSTKSKICLKVPKVREREPKGCQAKLGPCLLKAGHCLH